MKKIINLMIIQLLLVSCQQPLPSKVEAYIDEKCDWSDCDTYYINMKCVIGEYDKMYLFNSATPLTVARDIIGIHNYRMCSNPEIALLGKNIEEEYHYLIVVRNNKVIHEEEYNYREYRIRINQNALHKVFGSGTWDNEFFQTHAYEISDTIFIVTRKNHLYKLDIPH